MKCPFCSTLMEKGVLRSRGGVFFLPDGEGLPRLYTKKRNGKAQRDLFAAAYAFFHGRISCGPYLQDLR